MQIRIIGPEQQPTQAWRNGGGQTREIHREGAEQSFLWRASLAHIESSGPFSSFPGYQRLSCLVDGGPLTLIPVSGVPMAVEPRLRPFAYSGEERLSSLLLGPFATVFNVIANSQILEAQLLPRPLVGSMVFFNEPGTDWLIYLLSGSANLRSASVQRPLGSQYAALLSSDGDGGRVVLDGGGEVILVKLSRRS
jgi:uncharacterized protein